MISIKVFSDQAVIKSIEMTGHAQYADPGYDIVCAAVSSQVISVENSLEQLLDIHCQVEVDEDQGGYLKLILPTIKDSAIFEKAQFLLQHLVFALSVIQDNYPDFVKLSKIQSKP